jgi:hypothetical protein
MSIAGHSRPELFMNVLAERRVKPYTTEYNRRNYNCPLAQKQARMRAQIEKRKRIQAERKQHEAERLPFKMMQKYLLSQRKQLQAEYEYTRLYGIPTTWARIREAWKYTLVAETGYGLGR